MAVLAILPTTDTVVCLTGLFRAFGVGAVAATEHRLTQLQDLLEQGPDAPDLQACLIVLGSDWIATAALSLCHRLFWRPGQPLGPIMNGWAQILALNDPHFP
jgi:hypothetical protein